MPDYKDIYGGSYLTAKDVVSPAIGEVSSIDTVELDGEKKLSISLIGFTKQLVLNKTNARRMEEISGNSDWDKWVGVKIKVYTIITDYQGKEVAAIRQI